MTPEQEADLIEKMAIAAYGDSRNSLSRSRLRRALSIAKPIIRDEALVEAWRIINSMIVEGPLDGNGCDKSAERNGLVLASNSILEARDTAILALKSKGQKP